jgi:transcriptional regulator with XRE-family HTH domain
VFSNEYQIAVKHLRERVRRSGVPQIEIAARLNRPPTYLSKALLGRQSMTLIEMRSICRAAGIPFSQWVAEMDAALDAGPQEPQEPQPSG